MFPNFLCIGAQRSGTTWLHANLQKHPEVWMPPIKEIHYFDKKEMLDSLPLFQSSSYKRKYRYYQKNWQVFSRAIKSKQRKNTLDLKTLSWLLNYYFGLRSDQWYASLFDMGKGKTIGEITPEYGPLNGKSVAHIHQLMPDAKIIFLMRNPIQRAWSHLLKNLRDKKRPIESVSEAEFIKHFSSQKSRAKSNYLQIINTWKSYFPEEQFLIAFFEEIEEHPEELLLRIFDFIEVEAAPEHICPLTTAKKRNASSKHGIIPDKLTITDNLGQYLANIYYEEIAELNKHFGGYTNSWLKDANQLLSKSLLTTH